MSAYFPFTFPSSCLSRSFPLYHLFGNTTSGAGVGEFRECNLQGGLVWAMPVIQGYLAHKKTPPPRTLQFAYAWGHMVVLRGKAVSYEQGTPVSRYTRSRSAIVFGYSKISTRPIGI